MSTAVLTDSPPAVTIDNSNTISDKYRHRLWGRNIQCLRDHGTVSLNDNDYDRNLNISLVTCLRVYDAPRMRASPHVAWQHSLCACLCYGTQDVIYTASFYAFQVNPRTYRRYDKNVVTGYACTRQHLTRVVTSSVVFSNSTIDVRLCLCIQLVEKKLTVGVL